MVGKIYDVYRRANDTNYLEIAKMVASNFSQYREALEKHAVARTCYFVAQESHNGLELNNKDKGREAPKQEEKNVAKVINSLWCRDTHPYFGRILDFEVPLTLPRCEVRKDISRGPEDCPYKENAYKPRESPYPRGKIDLISVKDDALIILELKRLKSSETYLRCLLEAYTYVKTLKRPSNFIEEAKVKFGLPDDVSRLMICPLVFQSEKNRPFREFNNKDEAVLQVENCIKSDELLGERGIGFYAFNEEEQVKISDRYDEMLNAERTCH